MAKINEVEISSLRFDEQGSDPSTPASTNWRLYFKSGGLFVIDDAGTVIGPIGGDLVPPWAVVPDAGVTAVAALAFSATNRAVILPCTVPASVTITGIRYKVQNQSGNVCVGLYDEDLNRLATSGAVACPAAGQQTTAFTASYAASPGRYWLAMSCDNTTATFDSTNYSGTSTPLAKLQSSAHPLPDPFVPSSSDSRAPALWGIVDGGWAA